MILTLETHSPIQAEQLEQWDEELLAVAANLPNHSWQTPRWKSYMDACQKGGLDFLRTELESNHAELQILSSSELSNRPLEGDELFVGNVRLEIAQAWHCAISEALSAAHGEGCWLFAYQSAELANRLLVALRRRTPRTLAA